MTIVQSDAVAGADPTLRRAVSSDVAAIAGLVNLAYRVEAFFVAGDRTTPEEIADQMRRGTFLLVERGGALVGSAYVEDRGDHGYIGLVSVDPQLQGAGIGRLLMAAAEQVLIDAGRRRAQLLVVDLREELPPWYRRLGYREVGTVPFPPDAPALRPCRFVVMSKRLPDPR